MGLMCIMGRSLMSSLVELSLMCFMGITMFVFLVMLFRYVMELFGFELDDFWS